MVDTNNNQVPTAYTYDADSTCSPNDGKGNLVKKVDPVGNTTCYSYDDLNRVTAITYSGPYGSQTPSKYFVYDTATVNGVAMSYAQGRLAEACTVSTGTGCAGTKITDLGFTYSLRGEVAGVYELTPNSGGYYYVGAAYWANGLLNTLNLQYGPQPPTNLLPTLTYTPEGEGRVGAVTASAGQNPVPTSTATSYNVFGAPNGVTFGSSDRSTFTYDPNAGRMTQYKHTVNSISATGTLTWNANGTLQQLAINDALNSSDTQTCNYLYDDLTRITSANCGSPWSQTFSYAGDNNANAFGNLTKYGNGGNSATYSPATNRLTSIGNQAPSYDNNGNLTSDGTGMGAHSYSWDVDGNVNNVTTISVSAVSLTYDAFDRIVEEWNGSSYKQVVYDTSGAKLALMNGTTLSQAFVPLPAGATAVYTSSSTLHHYRFPDWLGSSRVAATPSRSLYYDGAYAPYGDNYAEIGTPDRSFTGQNQDTSPNLYDFLAREYAYGQGRWLSPDPAGLAAADLTNPQSLNRYAYVLNNPTSRTDPLGLDPCPPGTPSDVYCVNVNGGTPASIPTITIGCANMDGYGCGYNGPNYAYTGVAATSGGNGGAGTGASTPPAPPKNGLLQAAKSLCSAYPDVTQVGAGADFGAYFTVGAQVTLNANGNSGELSLSWAWVGSSGFAGPDAYVLAGVVRNAPTNQSLQGVSFGGNLAVGKTGISGNSNNIQGTFGPSYLPATISGQISVNKNLITIPYAGYVMNEMKGACTALFGKHN